MVATIFRLAGVAYSFWKSPTEYLVSDWHHLCRVRSCRRSELL